MTIEPAVLEELKGKHGELTELKAAGYAVLVKKPGRAQWRKFKTFAADENKRVDCVEVLFRDCVVYPPAPDVEAMLAEKPALAEKFGEALCEMAGAGEAVEKNAC